MTISIEMATSVKASTYNPRLADEERLALVELSLRKLGWLLSIFATVDGEIISGHQRHLVATHRIGLVEVPIDRLGSMSLDDRKALNIAFNRGTCDMDSTTSTRALRAELLRTTVLAMANELPDVDWNNPRQAYPCMFAKSEPIDRYLRANTGRWKHHAKLATRALVIRGARMPIVVGPDDVVVNGIGRLEYAAERSEKSILVVHLDAARAALAGLLLNLLSMDFDLETRYSDILRHNSFRRSAGVRSSFGTVWVFFAFGRKPGKTLTIQDPATRATWIARHGKNVLDFGAGHATEVAQCREVGIAADWFEPYRLTESTTSGSGVTQDIDHARSVAGVRAFLAVVASKKKWDSIFLSTVLNSVPFASDRVHIVRLCTALATEKTKLFSGCSNNKHPNWMDLSRNFLNESNENRSKFVLDYEPGITLGEYARTPKVQKYHTPEEVKALFGAFWRSVKLGENANLVLSECEGPKRVDPKKLEESIRFEFDLPYPGWKTMGLVDEALAAFKKRGCL